jgi:hypothetical protein
MATASGFGNCGLFHGPPDQNIYPSQFAPSNPHLEQSDTVSINERREQQSQQENPGYDNITISRS